MKKLPIGPLSQIRSQMTLLWSIGNGKRNGKEIEIIDNFEEGFWGYHWNKVSKGPYPLDD